MIEQVCLFTELFSVLICLFNFYCRKIKISVSLLTLQVIYAVYICAINRNIINKGFLPLIYMWIVLYALVEFRHRLIDTVFVCLMVLVITEVLRMLFYVPINLLDCILPNEDIITLVIDLAVCMILVFTKNVSIYKKLKNLCTIKETKMLVCIGTMLSIFVYYIYIIKKDNRIPMDVYITCPVTVMITMYLILRWQRADYEVELKEKQIEMMRMCAESFDNLIAVTRKNQHDFNNHIIAIIGMHNTIGTYGELVEAQRKYIGEIDTHGRYNKILFGIREPVLAGYLFYKISDIEQEDIHVTFQCSVSSCKIEYISVLELNEMIGILLDNAKEAVEHKGEGKRNIYLEVKETDSRLIICVANMNEYIEKDNIIGLFQKGYSTKDKNRGLGLAKIKDYQKKYDFDVLVENKEKDNNNWIHFAIIMKKDIFSAIL